MNILHRKAFYNYKWNKVEMVGPKVSTDYV